MKKHSRPWLFAIFFAAVLAACPSHRARATGPVLTPTGGLTTIDLELAVAVTPFGSARWTRLTVQGAPRVLWLVPARPGATLDWAANSWLDALEDVSTPRIMPPDDNPPCGIPITVDRPPDWTAPSARTGARALTLHSTESELRDYIAGEGFAVPPGPSTKITEAFTAGDAVVAIELDTNGLVTSPTLRMTDDGAATLPLALTGSDDVEVRVTALVLASGGAAIPGAQALDPKTLLWSTDGTSTFEAAREVTLDIGNGAVWFRESASNETLFSDLAVPHGTPIISLVGQYFGKADLASSGCVTTAQSAGRSVQALGRTCAAGALGRIPGGAFTCSPTDTPSALTCGDGFDDLAIALSGSPPAAATLTRFTGLVPIGATGRELPITTEAIFESPVKRAAGYEPCVATPAPAATAPAMPVTETIHRPHHYRRDSTGCDGSTTTLIFDDNGEEDVVDDDTGCDGTHTISPKSTNETITVDDPSSSSSTSSTSSTGGSTSSTAASGFDEPDPSSDDSCGSSSSSSSSDSCGCGGSDSSSSDSCGGDSSGSDSCSGGGGGDSCSGAGGGGGCDCQMSRQREHERLFGRPAHRRTRGRGGSPLSRGALFLIALALPLRRRTRPRTAS